LNLARGEASRLGAAIYYGGLRALGVTALRRRFQDAGLILCYHNVVSGEGDRVGDPGLHVPRERFERQIRWLAAHYDILSLREFTDRLAKGATLRSSAVITFDDGYAGIFEHAVPFLVASGIPATVFVVADAPGRSTGFWWDHPDIVRSVTPGRRERWLADLRGDEAAILSEVQASAVSTIPASHRPAEWATIRAHAGRGIDIGAHSATHRSLPTLDGAELEREVVASRVIVHQSTGVWPEFFAYPYGLWDWRIRSIVRRTGYRAGLALGSGLNSVSADLWSLRRVNVPAAISDAAFGAWTAGFPSRGAN
jgi:peptidoglycan/xylan/chitin deacetylase (PgdA/CDA1 family)